MIRVRIRVRIQIFRIKRLNVKFSKYQKQSPGDVLLQKQPPEVFCKKGVLRNFPKFTGKKPVIESLF